MVDVPAQQVFPAAPPAFMEEFRNKYFQGGRKSVTKWTEHAGIAAEATEFVFPLAFSRDAYHIIPKKEIGEWILSNSIECPDGTVMKPFFVADVTDNRQRTICSGEISWSHVDKEVP